MCNKYIKFDHFRRFAQEQGFSWLATGHYAKTEVAGDKTYLLKAKDKNKDQSYFLAQVSANAIAHTVFPLADLDKTEVRKIASRLDLAVAEKKDSTGICFIGERDFRAFLQNYLPAKEGSIIDLTTGKLLGKHIGVLYYTIGQRKGLGLSGGPWFVCDKDVVNNILYVCHVDHEDLLYSDSCLISGFNNLYGQLPEEAAAKFRYRQKDNPVRIEVLDESTLRLYYPQKVKAVTEGQEAVLYAGEICLGGGTIEKTYRDGREMSERLKELAHE